VSVRRLYEGLQSFRSIEADGRELDEGERVAIGVFPVLGQSPAAVEPGERKTTRAMALRRCSPPSASPLAG
jgi:hypothetical protein